MTASSLGSRDSLPAPWLLSLDVGAPGFAGVSRGSHFDVTVTEDAFDCVGLCRIRVDNILQRG